MIPPPEAVLFDIGNVLFHLGLAPALLRLVPPDDPDPAARVKSLLEKQEDLETGKIAESAFIAWASERLRFAGSPDAFRAAWCSRFHPIEDMWKLVPALRDAGLKLILFSNTNSIHAAWLKANHPLHLFHGEVFSHEAGAIKPDPALYHHAFRVHRLTPDRTLYVDDLPDNIRTGQSLGLRCHQYKPARHQEFTRWLDRQLKAGQSP